MKISITKTELYAMPNVAWNRFCDFMMDRAAEYTPIQRTAALCLRYYVEVYGDGHAHFFADMDNDPGELEQALTAIGAQEFAEKFMALADNQLHSGYDEVDAWFHENVHVLYGAIHEYWQNNIGAFYEIVDENYTMRQPKFVFSLGAFEAALFFVLMIVFSIVTPEDWLWICISFTALASLGLILMAYGKLWRISVTKDEISVQSPFRKKRTVSITEITSVEQRREGLILYVKGKKFTTIDRMASDFAMLCAQLWLAGKIVEEKADDLIIQQSTANVVTGLLCPFLGIGLFLRAYLRQDNPASVYELAFFAVVMLLSIYLLFHYLWWRVTISGDIIAVRKALRTEKEFRIADITKMDADKQNMIIFVQDKKAVKIPLACSGCAALAQRLENEGVPVYRNGKQMQG